AYPPGPPPMMTTSNWSATGSAYGCSYTGATGRRHERALHERVRDEAHRRRDRDRHDGHAHDVAVGAPRHLFDDRQVPQVHRVRDAAEERDRWQLDDRSQR